jgi:biotin transporter BioY
MLHNQKNILRKIIAISLLLFLAFFLEIISRYSINLGIPCNYALFHIELIFIILIGYLFGFKYGFWASLFYLLIHYVFEFSFMEMLFHHTHDNYNYSHNHSNKPTNQFLIFLYRFFLPYIVCSFSGFFYQKNFNHLNKKLPIIMTLVLISVFQIISSILFINLLQENFAKKTFFSWLVQSHSYSWSFNLIYSFSSVIINNIIIGALFYLINLRIKDNIEFLYYFSKEN